MITFRQTMDPHSLDIFRQDERIGALQWHPNRNARVVMRSELGHLDRYEMQHCEKKFQAIFKKARESS